MGVTAATSPNAIKSFSNVQYKLDIGVVIILFIWTRFLAKIIKWSPNTSNRNLEKLKFISYACIIMHIISFIFIWICQGSLQTYIGLSEIDNNDQLVTSHSQIKNMLLASIIADIVTILYVSYSIYGLYKCYGYSSGSRFSSKELNNILVIFFGVVLVIILRIFVSQVRGSFVMFSACDEIGLILKK